jgi:hypothetical protein
MNENEVQFSQGRVNYLFSARAQRDSLEECYSTFNGNDTSLESLTINKFLQSNSFPKGRSNRSSNVYSLFGSFTYYRRGSQILYIQRWWMSIRNKVCTNY